MTRFSKSLLLGLVASAAFACSSDIEEPTTPDNPNDTSGGGEGNTFDHENEGRSPWEIIADQAIAGPARYQARVHGCSTVLYQNMRNMLASRGINVGGAGNSAGGLYNGGGGALGVANYASRARSNRNTSTSGAVKAMDIYAAGAAEIITNWNTVTACQVGGATQPLFESGGATCGRAAFTCLTGAPVTDAHLDICNKTISGARNPTNNNPDQALGQRLAIAVMLSAAHTCE